MNEVTLDSDQRIRLEDTRKPTAVLDANGKVLGLYVPKAGFEYVLDAFANRPEPTREEIAEARQEMLANGFQGATTAEVLEGIADIKRKWEKRQ